MEMKLKSTPLQRRARDMWETAYFQIDFWLCLFYSNDCGEVNRITNHSLIKPPCSSGRNFNSCLLLTVLKFGSCAMIPREPCQIGNKAALSGPYHVPRGCLAEQWVQYRVKVPPRGAGFFSLLFS